MQPKKAVFEYIKKQGRMAEKDPEWQELFDGMSTGTARVVIDREAGEQLPADGTVDLENKGRYYVAKIISHNGRVLRQLLVDKQTGEVRLF
jgi:hypothetical protein